MNFALDSETRRRLGYKLIDHIDAFYASLPDRKVQLPAQQRTFGTLDDALPEHGDDAARVLDDLCRDMIDKGFHVPSPNYFGLMNPTPAYMGVLAEALVAALNPQLATLARSQLASKIEMETVRWIAERVGWGKEFGGTFTSGGNEANFSGLALALAAKFPQSVEDGVNVIGGPAVIYASAESHHSLDKSAGLLGIGRRALRRIEVNQELQLDLVKLENAIGEDRAAGKRPFCVVATAGTTNSGVVDELKKLAAICRRHGLWLHVDGAYGAAAVFSDKYRSLVEGIELADSITIDPHKWLAVPFAAGVILTRHPRLLEQTFSIASPYMPKDRAATLPDNARISTQWTRRMNSLKLWLTLRVHGRRAYEEHIDRQMKLAASFVEWLNTSEDYELVLKPTLPIVNFKLRGGFSAQELIAAHARVVGQVTEDGSRWISDTRVNGRSVLRMMIISYLTEERHLQGLQESLTRVAKTMPKD